MPPERRPSRYFSDLVEDAGIGSLIWGRTSYLAATYYHHVVAVFTAAILALSLWELAPWPVTVGCVLIYGLYFFGRTRLNPDTELKFYHPRVQFIRAQISLATVTLLIGLIPGGERSALWLLYLSVILLTSKHCRTTVMLGTVAQSCVALLTVRLLADWRGAPLQFLQDNPDLWIKILWLGLLSFILHYLVRNIQARDETIAGYNAVNTLTRDVDMADANWAKQWQPLLTTLLKHLEGRCASTWVCNYKTRQLELVAHVRRNSHDLEQIELGSAAGITVPLDSPLLIASVARAGQANHSVSKSESESAGSTCPGCCPFCTHDVSAELVVPINVGTNERCSTIGVLSVGFCAASFKERLLKEYQNFVQGLVNQAKPMLVYAQRLDELVALQQVSRQVSHSLELNDVLDNILRAVVDILGFEFATISLVDPERGVIRCERVIHVPDAWKDMAVHDLNSNDIQAITVRTGNTEVIAGWDARLDQQIWERFGHQDMIRVFTPIEVTDTLTEDEHIIGTIEAGYHRATRAEIAPDQLRMLEAFKNQVSMAIGHAQLLRRAQNEAKVLSSLHGVGQAIASAREPDKVLDEVGQQAAALLKADMVMLYLYDREKHVVASPLVFGDLSAKYRLNLNLHHESILSKLLSETQPYYSADAESDPQHPFRVSWGLSNAPSESDPLRAGKAKQTFMQRQSIQSFAAIPLIAQGETVGIMFVTYRARHPFGPDERQAHELFAQQAAVAIKNARNTELARELAVREERNHLSRELHHLVSQALFGITLQAQNAMSRLEPNDEPLQAEFRTILEMAHIASNETGFIIDELRAPVEEGRHLAQGLEEYADRVHRWYGLEVVIEKDLRRALTPQVEPRLLRFAREALNNAVRHAHCRSIIVRCESDSQHICVSICDNGIGFDPERVPPRKLGLISMKELATAVGGKCAIQTAPGAGTTVSLNISTPEETE